MFVGHCHDVHPDCDTFVMNGMCDQSTPFKEIFNVLELCKQSCGVCERYVFLKRTDFKLQYRIKKKVCFASCSVKRNVSNQLTKKCQLCTNEQTNERTDGQDVYRKVRFLQISSVSLTF